MLSYLEDTAPWPHYAHSVGAQTYRFDNLKDVMAKASPARSGDFLAGVAALNVTASAWLRKWCWPTSRSRHFLQEVADSLRDR